MQQRSTRTRSVGGRRLDEYLIQALSGMVANWDFSDMKTMFQDSTGTMPVTAVGQPVGLVLDKSKWLIRGPESVVNGRFDTGDLTGWTKPDTAPSVTEFFDGGVRMTAAPGSFLARLRQPITLAEGTYEFTVEVKNVTGTPGAALVLGNTSSGDTAYGNTSLYTEGTYRLVITITGPTLGIALTAVNPNGGSLVLDNFSVRSIPGVHLIQPTTVNRPIYALDANGKPSLSFNGTNQWMQTASNLDLSGTDKVTVVAGVMLPSDAASGWVMNHNSNLAGSFRLRLPSDNGFANHDFSARGTTWPSESNAAASRALAPARFVISGIADLSGAGVSLRNNKQLVASMASVVQTGNFVSAPLFIGCRSTQSLFFNGNLYSLAIRAALSTQPEIDLLERFANSKTKAY